MDDQLEILTKIHEQLIIKNNIELYKLSLEQDIDIDTIIGNVIGLTERIQKEYIDGTIL